MLVGICDIRDSKRSSSREPTPRDDIPATFGVSGLRGYALPVEMMHISRKRERGWGRVHLGVLKSYLFDIILEPATSREPGSGYIPLTVPFP